MGKFWPIRLLHFIGLTNLSEVEVLEFEALQNEHLPKCSAIISFGCPHVCQLPKNHKGEHKAFGNAGLPDRPIPFELRWSGDFNKLYSKEISNEEWKYQAGQPTP